MKKFLSFCLAISFFAPAVFAQTSDLKSPILKEVYYVMFERQVDNEIKNALMADSMSPQEAELTVAYLKTQIDMLALKRQTMECFEESGLNFAQTEDKKEEIAYCLTNYREQLAYHNKQAKENNDLPEELVAAGYFMAEGETPTGSLENRIMTVMKNVATSLALSRMNVRILHKKTLGCIRSLSDNKTVRLSRMGECTRDVSKLYDEETRKAMDELMPHIDFFLAHLIAQAR